ncbi:hypothetical protein N7517_007474 [Penicillium concentricum]|uniref:Uncharacterized protein n=1 Tax=Penicillium concentricum TaxID=293559 RepID=A0A9W9SB93_9EURO|nr:uncharacterized protein N7517_007474 [Penicillium concentricum]KAJ5375468.1 hypothetical protein N7517_007474 [Penicillium concentricum]
MSCNYFNNPKIIQYLCDRIRDIKKYSTEKKQEQRNVAQTAGGEPGPFHHQPQIETSTLIAQEPTFNSPPSLYTQ